MIIRTHLDETVIGAGLLQYWQAANIQLKVGGEERSQLCGEENENVQLHIVRIDGRPRQAPGGPANFLPPFVVCKFINQS